jgi:uncharacterized protein YceK
VKKPSLILALVGAALAGGCGTIVNFRYPRPEPYGGVKNDLQQVRTLMGFKGGSEYGVYADALCGAFLVADAPVSAITDTLTLPLVFILDARGPRPGNGDPTRPGNGDPIKGTPQYSRGAVAPLPRQPNDP